MRPTLISIERGFKALIDSGAQVSQITVGLARKMGLKIKPLKRLLKLEGAGGAHVKYMGYVKAYLDIPEIRAFNYPMFIFGPARQ